MSATTPRRGFQGDSMWFRTRYLEVFQGFFDKRDRSSLQKKAAELKLVGEQARADGKPKREREAFFGEAAAAEEAALAIEFDDLSDDELRAEAYLLRSCPVQTPRRRIGLWVWERRQKENRRYAQADAQQFA